MSDEDDWDFAGDDDAKVTVRAAVRYLLRGATAAGGNRGDIVQEIILIVRQISSGPPPSQPDALDDDSPSRKPAGRSGSYGLEVPGRSAPAQGYPAAHGWRYASLNC
jgi:hypothetical protein